MTLTGETEENCKRAKGSQQSDRESNYVLPVHKHRALLLHRFSGRISVRTTETWTYTVPWTGWCKRCIKAIVAVRFFHLFPYGPKRHTQFYQLHSKAKESLIPLSDQRRFLRYKWSYAASLFSGVNTNAGLHTQMSLLVHATCSAALSFFFCCRWVDGVAMLSVVKRNILKGRFSPPSLCRGGRERRGGKQKKEEEKYIKESDVLALFSHVPFTDPPTHTHTHTHTHTLTHTHAHTHTHTLTHTPCSSTPFLSLKSLTSVLKKIVFFSSFLFFLAPQHDTGLATSLKIVSVTKCLCLQLFAAVIRKHDIS